jgi:hypothetical protein
MDLFCVGHTRRPSGFRATPKRDQKRQVIARNTTLSSILAKAIYPNWLPGMLGRMAIDLATY